MTVAMAAPHPDLPTFTASRPSGREVQVAESIRLTAVAELRRDITLRTKEGDVVTLSLNQETVAVYGRDGRLSFQQGYREDGHGHAIRQDALAGEHREWWGLTSTRGFALSIEGNLSREEQRDIRQALGRIHQVLSRSFGFDAQTTPRLSGLDSLAGIEVDRRRSNTVLAARAADVSVLTYKTDGRLAPHPDQAPSTHGSGGPAAADAVVGIVAESGLAPQQFAAPLRQLFDHWARAMDRRQQGLASMVRRMAAAVYDRLRLPSPHGEQI